MKLSLFTFCLDCLCGFAAKVNKTCRCNRDILCQTQKLKKGPIVRAWSMLLKTVLVKSLLFSSLILLNITQTSFSLPKQKFKHHDLSLRLLKLPQIPTALPEFRPTYEYKYARAPFSVLAGYRPLKLAGTFRHIIHLGSHYHFNTFQSAEFYLHLPSLYFLLNPPGDPDIGIILPVIAGWGNRFGPINFKIELELLNNSISFINSNRITSPFGLGVIFHAGVAF